MRRVPLRARSAVQTPLGSTGGGRRRTALLAAIVLASFAPLVGQGSGQAAQASAQISMAMPMGPDQCQLTQVAFCDTFQTIVGGGREGDLDPAKWSFTRVTSDVRPFPLTTANTYYPAVAQFCKTTKLVQPDGDSFICGAQFGESNHWMETINDNGSHVLCNGAPCSPGSANQEMRQGNYVANAARIRQPFDFAGRTGAVDFSVDAHVDTSGRNPSHGFWPEVWLTDQPIQGPHLDHPGTHLYPRNGIAFVLNGCPLNATNTGLNSLGVAVVFNNYVPTSLTLPPTSTPGYCFTTQPDDANHFQIKVSQNHVEFWGSDHGGGNFRLLASLNINLNFTQGYLSFEHAHYNAEKYGSTNTSTYHWHAIGFDGPVLPADRGYEVPDALHVNNASDIASGSTNSIGSVNLGYQVGPCCFRGGSTPTFSLANVDPTNATQAYLTYTVWYDKAPHQMTATVNGMPFTFVDPNPDGIGPNCGDGCGIGWRALVQPIPPSALLNGTNTVSFTDNGSTAQNPTIANIDLEIVPSGAAAPATGNLRVVSSPPVPTQVLVDGHIADSWGLTWVTVPTGTHTVSFTHVSGYADPAPQTVTVLAGATTMVTGTFVQRGGLRVMTSPALPSEISVDAKPANDWGVWTDVAVGSHQVCFGAVAGYDPPACQTAVVTAGSLSTVTGTFTANPAATGQTGKGRLTVTTSPALAAQITITPSGGSPYIADSWGLNGLELAPGSYTVSVSHVQGFTEPAPQVVTVAAGQMAAVTATFAGRGELRVMTSPAVAATISVDANPADNWGVWTDLPTGVHQVCFAALAGYANTPACQTATLTAGTQTDITATYS